MESGEASSSKAGSQPGAGANLGSNSGPNGGAAGSPGGEPADGFTGYGFAGYGPGGPLSVDAVWTAPTGDPPTAEDGRESTDSGAQAPDCPELPDGIESPDGPEPTDFWGLGSDPDERRRASNDPPALTGQLGLAAVAGLDASQTVDALKDVAEAKAWLDAQEAKLVTRLLDLQAEQVYGDRGRLGFDQTLTASEVGAALHLSGRTAGSLVEHSALLTRHHPATLNALEEGSFSRQHAWAVVEEATSMPDTVPAVTVAFEVRLIAMAGQTTVAKFCHQARKLREELHPESIAIRHQKAVREREVLLNPAFDGMAWLSAYLPVEQAAGIYHRVDTAARDLQGPDESRTLTQLRADVFADVLTGSGSGAHKSGTPGEPGSAGYQGIQAKVFVTVPVMTLLGGDAPGELEGYGPIDPETARRLAGHAPSFTRILTHPFTGARLGADATTYRVPKDLQDAVRVRDGTCRHPGCNRLGVFCELDHTKPWSQGGKTSFGNLACLCKRHHMFKTKGYWHYQQPAPGMIIAISPAGETYVTRPDPPPAPPPEIPPPF